MTLNEPYLLSDLSTDRWAQEWMHLSLLFLVKKSIDLVHIAFKKHPGASAHYGLSCWVKLSIIYINSHAFRMSVIGFCLPRLTDQLHILPLQYLTRLISVFSFHAMSKKVNVSIRKWYPLFLITFLARLLIEMEMYFAASLWRWRTVSTFWLFLNIRS